VPVLLYIGTLADWQGLEVVIKALPKILENRTCSFTDRGTGTFTPEETFIESRFAKLGLEGTAWFIQPAVPHHEVPALIASADICLAPLGLNDRNVTQGACPIKVLEYMASSRPLIASNMPIVRELVREDVDALLFSPNDPEDLAAPGIGFIE
jgi:glycosyltransferase involved in cell wall biosynthesis